MEYLFESKPEQQTNLQTNEDWAICSNETTNGNSPENIPEVSVFISINNRGHGYTEIPQVLNSLKYLKEIKGIDRKLIVIKDAIRDDYYDRWRQGKNYDYDEIPEVSSLGKINANRLTTWYDDKKDQPGTVKVDGKPYELYNHVELYLDQSEVWTAILSDLGIEERRAADIAKMVFFYHHEELPENSSKYFDGKKSYWNEDGYAQGVNELLQLILVLNRAEQGEFTIKNLIISGHHYGGSAQIFGAMDSENHSKSDIFDTKILFSLSRVFPKAFSKIEALNIAACSSYMLDDPYRRTNGDNYSSTMDISELPKLTMNPYKNVKDIDGEETNEWTVFPSLQNYSYWTGTCPAATDPIGYKSLGKANLMTNIYLNNIKGDESQIDNSGVIGSKGDDKNYFKTLFGSQSIEQFNPADYTPLVIDSRKNYYEYDDLKQYIYQGLGSVSEFSTTVLQDQFKRNKNLSENDLLTINKELQWRTVPKNWILLLMYAYEKKHDGNVEILQALLSAFMVNNKNVNFESLKQKFKTKYGVRPIGEEHAETAFLKMITYSGDWITAIGMFSDLSAEVSDTILLIDSISTISEASAKSSLYPEEISDLISDSRGKFKTPLSFSTHEDNGLVRVKMDLKGIEIMNFAFQKTPVVEKIIKIKIGGEEKELRTFNKASNQSIYNVGVNEYGGYFPDGGELLVGKNLDNWRVINAYPGETEAQFYLPEDIAKKYEEYWDMRISNLQFTSGFFIEAKPSEYGNSFPAEIKVLNYGVVRWNSANEEWIGDLVTKEDHLEIGLDEHNQLATKPQLEEESDFKSLKLLNLDQFQKIEDYVFKNGKFAKGKMMRLLKNLPKKSVKKLLGKDSEDKEKANLIESILKIQKLGDLESN